MRDRSLKSFEMESAHNLYHILRDRSDRPQPAPSRLARIIPPAFPMRLTIAVACLRSRTCPARCMASGSRIIARRYIRYISLEDAIETSVLRRLLKWRLFCVRRYCDLNRRKSGGGGSPWLSRRPASLKTFAIW